MGCLKHSNSGKYPSSYLIEAILVLLLVKQELTTLIHFLGPEIAYCANLSLPANVSK